MAQLALQQATSRKDYYVNRNIKTIKITVPNEQILKRLNSTPTFNRLSRLKLQVGENIENVNHAQFADMVRLYPLIGVTVEEVV